MTSGLLNAGMTAPPRRAGAGLEVDVNTRFKRCAQRHGGPAFAEVKGPEDDVRGPIAVRPLQLVTDVAMCGERQALFRHRRTTYIAAQSLELLRLIPLAPPRETPPRASPGPPRTNPATSARPLRCPVEARSSHR